MRAPESRHQKLDIQSLGRGYPDTLQMFRMRASKFWYVGMYVPARGRFVKKSTRCERLIDARDFAKDWYEERVLDSRNNKVIEEQSFAAFAQRFQTTQQRQISRGELVEEMFYNDKLKLDSDLLPYLGYIHVSKIDYNLVDNFIAEIHAEKRSVSVIFEEVHGSGA